jgi:hypothetical protein
MTIRCLRRQNPQGLMLPGGFECNRLWVLKKSLRLAGEI